MGQQPQGPVTYVYPVQHGSASENSQIISDGSQQNAVAYIVAPSPPSMVAPYCVPTRHMEPFEVRCYACGEHALTKVKAEKSIY